MTAVIVRDEVVGVGQGPYTATDVLNLAETLLRRGQCWVKGELVVNAAGEGLYDPEAHDADKWCLMGSLFAAAGRLDLQGADWRALDVAMTAVCSVIRRQHNNIPHFNDDPATTWSDVERVLQVAKERV